MYGCVYHLKLALTTVAISSRLELLAKWREKTYGTNFVLQVLASSY